MDGMSKGSVTELEGAVSACQGGSESGCNIGGVCAHVPRLVSIVIATGAYSLDNAQ